MIGKGENTPLRSADIPVGLNLENEETAEECYGNFLSLRFSGKLFLAIAFAVAVCSTAVSAAPPLAQEVYVWQRAWKEPVREAVSEHGGSFSNIVALAAEVSWKNGEPVVARIPLDFQVLASTKRTIGLALRVGAFSGPFATNNSVARTLTSLASSLVSEAETNHIKLGELQLDFDCAESKLDGYRLWVETIRKQIAPVPLTITTLPSWLKQPSFQRLIAASDGYVLQVHSLEKPKSFDAPFTLCDPKAALAAVEKASSFGLPFRVALPTYGYVIAFSTNGQFVGLSAEGPAKSWPANAKLREVRSDPIALALLMQTLEAKQLPALRGIIWYRLPVSVDNLNWRWPTLNAIVNARLPREKVQPELRRVEDGLVEIKLVNNGELDVAPPFVVAVSWPGARLVAGDGLRGFELVETGAAAGNFKMRSQASRLSAGEQLTIGWLRFDKDVEVQLEIEKQ